MTKHTAQQLRIIAGKWRSRKIHFPADIEGLRPTTDRIRETTFNWLSPYLAEANCLDLFAGSGALSFEALSRGAHHATQLDTHPLVIKHLQENAKLLGATPQCGIQRLDAISWLNNQQHSKNSDIESSHKYDIVFIDPPFRSELITPCLQALNQYAPLLNPKALIYIEVSTATPVSYPETWDLLKQRVAGQVCFSLLQVP